MDDCNSVSIKGWVLKERDPARGYLILQGKGFRTRVITSESFAYGTYLEVQGRLSTYTWYIPNASGRTLASSLSVTALHIQKAA